MADAIPQLAWMAEPDGNITWYNRRWYEYTGSTFEQMQGWGWQSVHHPDELATVMKRWQACIASGQSFDMVFPLKGHDGVFRHFLTRVEPQKDGSGKVLRWFGTNTDISQQKDAEERLQHALSAGRGIGTWDWEVPSGKVVADERFARLYGVDVQAANDGAPITDFFKAIHPDDVARVQQSVSDALKTGALFSEEYRLLQADGTERWVIAEGRCQLSADGSAVRFPGVTFDITDRKVAEKRLLDLNAALERKVIEIARERALTWKVSPDLLGALDGRGYFVSTNPAWQTVLGWSEQEVASMSIFELLHPDDVERTRIGFNLTQQGEPAIRFPNRYRHKNGTYRWISWVGVPEQGLVYCSGRDITEEKEQAHALEVAQEALRQSQKMEAIGQLTGGIAHDFNNLLQVIAGNLQLIGKLAKGNEKIESRTSKAQAAVQRGAKLSNQLLAFGRKQPLDPKVVHVGRLLNELDDLLRRSIGDSIDIETIIGGGLWNAFVDPSQLENAILNLAINARDAMQGTGKLTIEVHNASLDDAYAAQNPDIKPGQYVAIVVTDVGPGMTPEVAAQAFEPFFTTKPVGQGTGLGLAMVYGFMKQSGGNAKIYTEVGHGTTVRLYLPRSTFSEDVVVDTDFGPADGGNETILVAEDDESVRTTSVELLSELGYRVLQAADADSALAIINSGLPIDLLFTDVVMPGSLKSPELAQRARARLPEIAVLFTSGYTENAIVHGGRLDPNVDLLSKPYTGDALARKIRHVLANQALRQFAERKEDGAPRGDVGRQRRLRVLLVEDDELILDSTADSLQALGHLVQPCSNVDAARTLLSTTLFDVLMTDVQLAGTSGLELATHARAVTPDIGVVFATGGGDLPQFSVGRPAMTLHKPYNTAGIAKALGQCLERDG